jgi:hypothetical protein
VRAPLSVLWTRPPYFSGRSVRCTNHFWNQTALSARVATSATSDFKGCLQHPSYAQGHGTVAGACVTILKAFFDGTFVIPDPVTPSTDGLSLLPYTGPDATVVQTKAQDEYG